MLQVDGSGRCSFVPSHSAQEHSFLMPTFLEVVACRAVFCPFACTFQEEEPWSAHGCPGADVYAIVIDGPYAQEGALLRSIAPIEHPLGVIEADGRATRPFVGSSMET
jgi:hypothetical protein